MLLVSSLFLKELSNPTTYLWGLRVCCTYSDLIKVCCNWFFLPKSKLVLFSLLRVYWPSDIHPSIIWTEKEPSNWGIPILNDWEMRINVLYNFTQKHIVPRRNWFVHNGQNKLDRLLKWTMYKHGVNTKKIQFYDELTQIY